MNDPRPYADIEQALSRERLFKYLQASKGDLPQAIALYERNMRLSEAFYTPLQCLEICLRNKISARLTLTYGAAWYKDPATGLHEMVRRNVADALVELARSRRKETPGAVVAELSFGVWVALLAAQYDDSLWRRSIARAFRPDGRGLRRDIVHGRLNALRRFRNRVAHHEPIFQRDLAAVHGEIIEAIWWMCPATAAWVLQISRLAAVNALWPPQQQ
jgi:hypothetical protein